MIRLAGLLLLVGSGLLAAEPRVTEAKVWSENRHGAAWNVLSGAVEAETEASPEALARTITDWNSYPRLFPKIRAVSVTQDQGRTALTEDTLVAVLGFTVRNRFTILITEEADPVTGVRAVSWSQGWTDGTMDDLAGRWELRPRAGGGTLLRYRTRSAVLQTIPGQDGILGLFFSGELKQIVNAVLNETRQRKEKP